MTKPGPKFIVIEGVDGWARTTQMTLLAKNLKEYGVPLYTTEECSEGSIAKLLRQKYLPGRDKYDDRLIAYLYAVDRYDHITCKKGIMWQMADGKSVLCNQYVLSSLVWDTYKHVGNSDYRDTFEDIYNHNRHNLSLLTPDLTIYIDSPTNELLSQTIVNRDNLQVCTTTGEIDDLREAYINAINYLRIHDGHKIKVVSGVGSNNTVAGRIWDVVKTLYPTEVIEQ